MTKVFGKNAVKEFRISMKELFSNKSIRAIALSLLFIVSGVGASVLINPAAATPNSAAPSAAAPAAAQPAITQAVANWAYPNGNAFGQDYNPQNQINSSNAQYLGLSWIYPLPALPTSLDGLEALETAGVGVDPLIVNGTAIVILQYDEVLAFNVANGDVLWTLQTVLAANETLASGAGGITAHAHDGSEEFTTATFGSGVSGPTFWFEGGNARAYAINALNGKEELNFSTYTGLNMVAGNSPDATYSTLPASNIVISPQTGILVSSMGNGGAPSTGRSFFAGWNLNTNPPSLKWVTYDTPPQPFGNAPLNPYFDTQLIANMTGAETFFPGENGSTNGYTTPTEVAGGVLVNHNDDIVVNWKSLSATQLNSTLYNDWGYSDQSAQCQRHHRRRLHRFDERRLGWRNGCSGSGQTRRHGLRQHQQQGPVRLAPAPRDLTSGPRLDAGSQRLPPASWIWGFQANAHDLWDYDCSWSQAMGNETISGVNTQVIFKTCKNGYLYELNAVTGNLIWAWSPPSESRRQVQPGARSATC